VEGWSASSAGQVAEHYGANEVAYTALRGSFLKGSEVAFGESDHHLTALPLLGRERLSSSSRAPHTFYTLHDLSP
jgi:hypothetical protein